MNIWETYQWMNTWRSQQSQALYYTGGDKTTEATEDNSFTSALSKATKSASATGKASFLELSESMDQIFEDAAREYGIDVQLLKAIGKAESNFDPSVTSSAGAMGVMQLMPATAESLGVDDPYDARANIMGGASYIGSLLEKYDGDVTLALAAYNAGSGNVAKYGGVPPFKETQNYIEKIKGYLGEDLTTGQTVQKSTESVQAANEGQSNSSAVDYEFWNNMVEFMRMQMEMKLSSIVSFDSEEF